MAAPRIGVVGATGAVGTITLELLAERGYDVRAFASARSAGSRLAFGDDEILVEEATHEALSAGDVDLFLFSVGTGASRELVPIASAAGAICIDKSSAYRLVDGYPLVVPEVNADRALESLERDRIVANPNCCTIPLTCVLKPLHDVVPLLRVHVATYQSVSGAGAQRMEQLRAEPSSEHNLVMDWDWDGVESDEESKLRAETRKILELPDLAISATCVRVPVLVGHSEAIWVEFEEPLSPDDATAILSEAPSVRVLRLPEVPDTEGCSRWRRGARRADSQGRGLGQRPRALPLLRQPQKGSGAERDPDRRSAARRCRRGLIARPGALQPPASVAGRLPAVTVTRRGPDPSMTSSTTESPGSRARHSLRHVPHGRAHRPTVDRLRPHPPPCGPPLEAGLASEQQRSTAAPRAYRAADRAGPARSPRSRS